MWDQKHLGGCEGQEQGLPVGGAASPVQQAGAQTLHPPLNARAGASVHGLIPITLPSYVHEELPAIPLGSSPQIH